MSENWRPVDGYEGFYEVSDLGNVRSVTRAVAGVYGSKRVMRSKPIRPWINRFGYPEVSLWRDNNGKAHRIHRLVLIAFVGPCPDGMEGCHNDGDRANPRLENLRWDTPTANQADRKRHGTNRQTHCKRGHAFTPDNTLIRKRDQTQICRACKDMWKAQRLAEQGARA